VESVWATVLVVLVALSVGAILDQRRRRRLIRSRRTASDVEFVRSFEPLPFGLTAVSLLAERQHLADALAVPSETLRAHDRIADAMRYVTETHDDLEIESYLRSRCGWSDLNANITVKDAVLTAISRSATKTSTRS
jgi:hypothetical protein